jgi:putative oxygen-independent coproporphyrinogen III oxidase
MSEAERLARLSERSESERDGAVATERGMKGSYAVYVHIPFCATRCDYCAFATWTDRIGVAEAYVDAVRRDIVRSYAADGLPAASSVFFGGGTPSILPGPLLMTILDAIPRTAGAEVTVECNPDTVTAELLAAYRHGGVNRLSFGVQSMVPAVLKTLGRSHDPDNVRTSVELAREAGFESFNLDLIYGAVGESIADWETTLTQALALEPPHISAYGLTVEPGTPLADDPARHPDDDEQADKYILTDEMLGAAGLANYEISNWAKPGHECKHNLLYWEQGNYLGVGSAAHSHHDGRRWWRIRTPERYIEQVDRGLSTEAAGETLDAPTRRFEGLELALRTSTGVPAAQINTEGLDGLVETRGVNVVLTRSGRLLANEIAMRLADG